MIPCLRELRAFQLESGKMPFVDWLRSLKDERSKNFIRSRLDRLEKGNPEIADGLGGVSTN